MWFGLGLGLTPEADMVQVNMIAPAFSINADIALDAAEVNYFN